MLLDIKLNCILFKWNVDNFVALQINLLMVENCSVLLILITLGSVVFSHLVEKITKYKMQLATITTNTTSLS